MRKNFFKNEVKRRGEVDKTTYAMLGAEIKRLRLKNRKTLSSIAENLCSISYVCKIERAQIKPNRQMLGEIFKRLDASDTDMKSLFDLKDFIVNSVKWFYSNNSKSFEDTINKIKGLDNYRTTLFKFIYYIYIKDLLNANKQITDIYKIADILTNGELYIFLLFCSIMDYYMGDYEVAIDNLKMISNLEENNFLGILAYSYIFKCYFKMNHPLCLVYGENLSNFYFRLLEYEKGEEIRYLSAVYKAWNGMGETIYKEMGMLKEKKYRTTLDFYIRIQKPKIKINDFMDKLNMLTPFAKLLALYISNDPAYLDVFIETDKQYEFELEYSHNIANYLLLNDDEEKVDEIIRCIIPNIEFTKNGLEKNFFLDQLCCLSMKNGKYKLFCMIYNQLKNI